MSYAEKCREQAPYLNDEGYTVHVRSLGGSGTKLVPSLHDQYQQRVSDLQHQYPNYEFLRDPQAARDYYGQVYRAQEELDYYPELDPRMASEYQSYGGNAAAAHMSGYYPYRDSPNYQARYGQQPYAPETAERPGMDQYAAQSEPYAQDFAERPSMDQYAAQTEPYAQDYSERPNMDQYAAQSEPYAPETAERPSMDRLYGAELEQGGPEQGAAQGPEIGAAESAELDLEH